MSLREDGISSPTLPNSAGNGAPVRPRSASGARRYEEFNEAAKHLGFTLSPEHMEEQCLAIDSSGDGVIDEEEFVKFIQSQTKLTAELPEGFDASAPGVIFDHIGTKGSQDGYSAARAILKKRPAAAQDKMKGHGKGSQWTPLHYLLIKGSGPEEDTRTDAGRAAGRAHRLVAEPLVLAILEEYKPAASQRCMEGARFPKGHLPLELAIVKGWSTTIVAAIAKTYPKALEQLDGGDEKTQKKIDKDGVKSLKGVRYMRAIAEACHADDEIVVLLPKPKAKGGSIEWQSGADVQHQAEEKAQKKADKEAKKAAKAEAKRQKEAAKRAKAEAAAAPAPAE